jgi:ankyrin repeat protein
MQRLVDEPTLGDLKRTLSNLPRLTAEEFYRDELKKIRRPDGRDGGKRSETGLKILSLVYFSGQRLSLEALQYAIALKVDATDLPRDEDHLRPTDIRTYTRSLVSVHEESGYVSPFHQTARTYFDRVRWCDFPEAAQDIISMCAKHLSFLGTEIFPTADEFGQHPFTKFALTTLGDQIRLIESMCHDDLTFHKDRVTLQVAMQQDSELLKMSSVYHTASGSVTPSSNPWVLQQCVMSRDLRELLVTTALNPMVRELFFSESQNAKKLYSIAPTDTVPLHFGALLGSQFLVNALLTPGALIDYPNSQDDTALTISIKLGFKGIENTLLKSGAAFDFRFPSAWEVLLHSMTQDTGTNGNHACIAENALEKAVARAKKKKYSNKANEILLLKSAFDGHYKDFASALSICSKLRVRSDLFITAFIIAVEQKRLTSRESSVTTRGFQNVSTHRNDYDKIIERLLDHGIDVNAYDSSGNTALHRAARWNSLHMVGYLLEHGADPNIKNTAGHTPWYTISNETTHQAVSQLLIAKGADPDTCDNDGVSSLYRAAAGGHIESMMAVLEAGANPGTPTRYGWQPLVSESICFSWTNY